MNFKYSKFSIYAVLILGWLILGSMNSDPKIKGIELNLVASSPLSHTNSIESTLQLYYFKDNTLLRYPETIIIQSFQGQVGEGKLKQTEVEEKTIYKYSVFSKKSDRGSTYESLDQATHESFTVDSMLRYKAFQGIQLYDPQKYRLMASKNELDKSTFLVEIYEKSSLFRGQKDTLIVHYSKKLDHIPYSLCKNLDNPLKGKVKKLELRNWEMSRPNDAQSYNKVKIEIEYQELIDYDKDVLSYFQKFITEHH